MIIDPAIGEEITIEEAATLTARYREENPGSYISHFFGRDILTAILDQEDCIGIRIFFGLDEAGKSKLVLVGADSLGDDMLDGIVADRSQPCPTYCGKENALNGNGS